MYTVMYNIPRTVPCYKHKPNNTQSKWLSIDSFFIVVLSLATIKIAIANIKSIFVKYNGVTPIYYKPILFTATI